MYGDLNGVGGKGNPDGAVNPVVATCLVII
jgi:hypothetical protein